MTELIDINKVQPLEDRIFDRFKNETHFSAHAVVTEFSGRDSQPAVYRALRNLAKEGRIKFEGYVDRKKIYSPRGNTDLPTFKNRHGDVHPLTTMLTTMTNPANDIFDGQYHWRRALSLDSLMPVLVRLFVVAQFEDEKDMRAAFNKTITELVEHRETLTWMLSLVNDVLKHNSMKGDMKVFKRIFNGDDEAMPTPQQINEFKIWYKQFVEAHNAE